MENSLIELKEQIKTFKKLYYTLLGACTYTFNFSNYTKMSKEKVNNEIGAKSLNNKIKKINELIVSLQKNIDNL